MHNGVNLDSEYDLQFTFCDPNFKYEDHKESCAPYLMCSHDNHIGAVADVNLSQD